MESNKGFLYSLIANSKKIVLADFTQFKGNFSQIIRGLLEKIVKKGKVIINYDKYKIHYLYEDNIILILFSENVNDNYAFSFLNDVKKEILDVYTMEQINNLNSFLFEKGKKILENRLIFYNYGATTTIKGQIINNLNFAKDAVFENLENLIERNNKMDIIVNKSENLTDFSNNLSSLSNAVKTKEQEKNRKNKYIYFFIIIIIIIILIILYK